MRKKIVNLFVLSTLMLSSFGYATNVVKSQDLSNQIEEKTKGNMMLDEINNKLVNLKNLENLSSNELLQRKFIVVKEMNRLIVLLEDPSQSENIHERANKLFDLYQARLREIFVTVLNQKLKERNMNKETLSYSIENGDIFITQGDFSDGNIQLLLNNDFTKLLFIDLNFKEIRVINNKTQYAKSVTQKMYKEYNEKINKEEKQKEVQ